MIVSGLLFRDKTSAKYEQSIPFTTVVIAARNEQNNLPSLLDDLVNQKIDKNKFEVIVANDRSVDNTCLLYTSPSPRDTERSRMPSSA